MVVVDVGLQDYESQKSSNQSLLLQIIARQSTCTGDVDQGCRGGLGTGLVEGAGSRRETRGCLPDRD